MADHGRNRDRAEPNRQSAARSGLDPARIVVGFLVVGVLIAVVSMLVAPSPPPGPAPAASASLEAKVFEGRKYKYHLRTPAGSSWRVLPDVLVRQRAREADLGLERAGGDTAVFVLANEVPGRVALEEIIAGLAAVEGDGMTFEEIERAPLQKGEDRALFVRGRRSGGGKSVEMYLLTMIRDDVVYVVTAGAPAPVSEALAAELATVVREFEPPAPEEVAALPAPPLPLPEPPAPATGLLDPRLRDAPPNALRGLAMGAASQSRYQEAATLVHLALTKGSKEGEYELACYESRSGRVEASLYWLQRGARDEGVDADWADEDPDLAAVRKDPRWLPVRAFLRKTQRYWAQHPIDSQVVVLPKGHVAGRPIPVIVALHGLGSNPESFAADWSQKAADSLSVALVSVSATKTRGPKSFVWAEDVERDRARIEKALATLQGRVTIADGKIMLIGFSQGAQMAAEIAARHPDRYAGAIAMSPGNRSQLALTGLLPGTLGKRRFVVVAGAGEHPDTVKQAADDADHLRVAGAEVHHHAYPEMATHTFPPDFEKAFPGWVRFVLEGTPLPK